MFLEPRHSQHRSTHWLWIVSIVALAGPGARASAEDRPVSFVNDVVPVLTKSGCNMGTCHAKAGGGQNGFQLSLLGFEPAEDFEHLVLEGRGRRLSFGSPDQSLLLLKASGQVPHGGGLRLPKLSPGYSVIREWIRQGVPMDGAASPKLVSLEIEPKKLSLPRQGVQQLKVSARYSDEVRRVGSGAAWERSVVFRGVSGR